MAPIEVSASDALSDTQASFMAIFEARKQRHGVLVDILYTDVESDTALVPDPINLTLKSVSRNKMFSAAYEYGLYNRAGTTIDILAGLRYWEVDALLEFGGGLGALAGKRIHHAESWTDPLVGIKGTRDWVIRTFMSPAGLPRVVLVSARTVSTMSRQTSVTNGIRASAQPWVTACSTWTTKMNPWFTTCDRKVWPWA